MSVRLVGRLEWSVGRLVGRLAGPSAGLYVSVINDVSCICSPHEAKFKFFMREFIKAMREGNHDQFAKIAATSGLSRG